MKVMTITTDFLPKIGGISNHILNLNRKLNSMGVTAEIFQIVENSDKDSLETLHKDGYTVHKLFIKDDIRDLRKAPI